MRRGLLLLGLVLTSLAVADTATAKSGSDSSGQHSYDLECVEGTPTFTNTGSGDILVRNPAGTTTYLYLNPGNSGEYDWSGDWKVAFPDPPNSANYVVFDSGGPIDCDDEIDDPAYAASASIDCANEAIRITNDGTAPIVGYGSNIGSERQIPVGGSATVPWGRDPGGNMLDPSIWEAYTINADTSETLFDTGSFTLAEYEAQCVAEEELTYSYTAEPVCVADFPHVRFTATGTGDVYIAQNTHSADLARAGGPPITLPWDEHQAIPFPTTDWDAIRTDTFQEFDHGSFTLADDDPCHVTSPPSAPRSLAATPGNRSVKLTWLLPTNNGGAVITDYVIQRSPNGTTGWADDQRWRAHDQQLHGDRLDQRHPLLLPGAGQECCW